MKIAFPNVLRTLFLALILGLANVASAQKLETVAKVDLAKYAGKWYEIASFPLSFQKGCTCTTAEYTLSKKGFVVVENRCNRDSVNGKPSYIKGKAFAPKNGDNAKLKVQFFWPFKGKYWIIDLASDYTYAVVSNPKKNSLWILSRTSKMDNVLYAQILARLQSQEFDLSKLKRTEQI